MTDKEANAINIDAESDIETLKILIKFWQEKAMLAEFQLLLMRGNLSNQQIKNSFKIESIKEIMVQNNNDEH